MPWKIQRKFFRYFIKDKSELLNYFVLSILVGLLELMGVALIYPFINEILSTNPSDKSYMPLVLGGLIVCAFLCKNLIMIFYNFLQADFVKNCEAYIDKRFMNFFLNGNYNIVSRLPLSRKLHILGFLPPNAINNYLVRILNLIVNFFIFGIILGFLFIKFFKATVITLISSGILLFVQTTFLKRKTSEVANNILRANEELNQACNEPLINLKSIKVSRGEEFFIKKYNHALDSSKKYTRDMLFYGIIPPYVTEPFIIILLLILLSIIYSDNISNPPALIASYAVIAAAIFRLAPTLSRIQVNLTNMNANLLIVEELISCYEEFSLNKYKYEYNVQNTEITNFQKSIEFKDVSFSYNHEKNILQNISFKINKGDFVGIVGESGIGKTTLADIIAGLLEIKSGKLYLDEKPVPSNKMPPLKIGYVPQETFMTSASIRENVAFANEDIDDTKVFEALKKTYLYEFIEHNFEDGIYSKPFIDNKGFSQGQKQRLAIARALYTDPDIILLDEATSALDLKTEQEICEVLTQMKGKKTIIAIAHRISTIKNCDKIIFINKDKKLTIGTFEDLYNKSQDFKELVDLNSTNSIH